MKPTNLILEEVARSLLRVTVSKDGSWHDFACGRPSRRRALILRGSRVNARAPQMTSARLLQDEDQEWADMIRARETVN